MVPFNRRRLEYLFYGESLLAVRGFLVIPSLDNRSEKESLDHGTSESNHSETAVAVKHDEAERIR